MTNAPSCVALGIGLLTNTSFALAQTSNSILVAQITGSVPSPVFWRLHRRRRLPSRHPAFWRQPSLASIPSRLRKLDKSH
jgi:hypothetical protein